MAKRLTVLTVAALILLSAIAITGPFGFAGSAEAAHSSDKVYVDKDFDNSPGDGSRTAPFETIQEAVNHANPGDTIIVGLGEGQTIGGDTTPDVYSENVEVNKSVSIVANNASVIEGSVTIANSSQTLSNIVIANFEIRDSTGDGVRINTTPAGTGFDIDNVTIFNNTIHNVSTYGVALRGNDGTFADVTVLENTVYDSPDGVGVVVNTTGENTSVINNTLTGVSDTAIVLETNAPSSDTIDNTSILLNNGSTTARGLDITVESGTVTDLNVSVNTFTGTTTQAVRVTSNGTVSNVGFFVNAINETSGTGLMLAADTGTIEDVNVSANNASRNPTGVVLSAGDGTGKLVNITVQANPLANVGGNGVSMETTGSGNITDVLIRGNGFDATDTGVNFGVEGSVGVSDVNVTGNRLNDTGSGAIAIQTGDFTGGGTANATLENVDVVSNLLNDTGAVGVLTVTSEEETTVTDVRVFRNTFNGTASPIRVDAVNDSNVTNLNVTNNVLTNVSTLPVNVTITDTTNVSDVSITENLLNESGQAAVGIAIDATGQATLTNVDLVKNDLRGPDTGISVTAVDDTTVSDFNVTANLINQSTSAVAITAGTAGASGTATIQNVDLVRNGLNKTTNQSTQNVGLDLDANADATISDVRVFQNVLTDNYYGIRAVATDNGTIQSLNVTESLLESNEVAAALETLKQGTVEDVTFNAVGLNQSYQTGLSLSAADQSTISDIGIDTADISNNTDYGVYAQAQDTATIANVSVLSALVSNAGDGSAKLVAGSASAGGNALIRNVTFDTAGLNNSAGPGLAVDAYGTSNVSDLALDTVDASGNPAGLFLNASDNSTVEEVSIRSTLLGNTSVGDAAQVTAGEGPNSAGTVRNVSFDTVGLNKSAGVGLSLSAVQESTITGLTVSTADISNNTDYGVYAQAQDTATIAAVNVSEALISDADLGAAKLIAGSATGGGNALIRNVTFDTAGLNNTDGPGLAVDAYGTSNVSDLALDTVDASGNPAGLFLNASDNSTVEDVSIRSVLLGSTTSGDAAQVMAGDGATSAATVRNVTFDTAGLNNSAGTGLDVDAHGTSTVTDLTLDTVDASGNAAGLSVTASDNATVRTVVVRSVLLGATTTGDAAAFTAGDAANSAATIRNVSFDTVGLNNSAGAALTLTAAFSAAIDDVTLDTADASGNAQGLDVNVRDNASITGLTVTSVLLSDNPSGAANITVGTTAGGSGSVQDVRFDTVGLNNGTAGADGLTVAAYGTSTVTNLTVDTADASGTAVALDVQAWNNSVVSDLNVTTALLGGAGSLGARLRASTVSSTASATIEDVRFDTVGLNNTAGTGFRIAATGAGTVRNLTLSTASLAGNAEAGAKVTAMDSGTVRNVTFATVAANDTTNGPGIAFRANGSATVRELNLTLVLTKNNTRGLVIEALEGATVRQVNVSTTLHQDNRLAGLRLAAGTPGSSAPATLTDVNVSLNGFLNTSSGAGVNVTALGNGTVADVDLLTDLFQNNTYGVRYGAAGGATIRDVNTTRVLIEDNDAGVYFDSQAGATHQRVRVTQAFIRDNAGGVNISSTTPTAGLRLRVSFLEDNARGVVNRNADENFSALLNYWGATDGPSSSPDASSTPLVDPATGKQASGAGDTVSEGATNGVSNVRFDPALGGKNRCAADDELIDPVPAQSFGFSLPGINISQGPLSASVEINVSGQLSDFVGVCAWERAVFPLRTVATIDGTNTEAATRVRAPRLFLVTTDEQVSLNREFFAVFEDDTAVSLSYRTYTGADTSRFAGEDAQLVVLRANESRNVTGAFEFSTPTISANNISGRVTFGTDGVEFVEVRNVTLDANGELGPIQFTPSKPGDYVALLATVESGPGFSLTQNGRLTFDLINGSTTIIGTERVLVQQTSSNVTPTQPEVEPNGSVTFRAESNLNAANVTHAVVMYDNASFENKLIKLNTSESVARLSNGALTVNLTGTAEGEPFVLSVNTSTNGTVTNITTTGNLTVDSALGVVRDGDATENVSVSVGPNVSQGTYKVVHLAVASSNASKRSTDTDAIEVNVRIPNITVSPFPTVAFGRVSPGSSGGRTVTVSNTGNGTLTINSTTIFGTNASAFSITSGVSDPTIPPGESRSIRVRFAPSTKGSKQAKLRINSTDPDTPNVTVTLTGRAAKPKGGAGAPPSEEPAEEPVQPPQPPVRVNVTQVGNVTQFTLRNLQANVTVTLELPGPAGRRVGVFQRIRFTPGAAVGDASVSVQSFNRSGPTGAPALDVPGSALQYLNVTTEGLDDAAVRSVQFRFLVNESALGANGRPENVALYRFNESTGEWNALNTTFLGQAGNGRLLFEATSPGFSVFAIGVNAPSFTVTGGEISPTQAGVGETVTITATVENTGAAGNFTAELTADGETLATRTVAIAADTTETIEFEVTFDEAAFYQIAVNDITIGFVDVGPVTTTTTAPPTTTTTTTTAPPTTTTTTTTAPPTTVTTTEDEGFLGLPGFGFPVAIVALLALALLALRRRDGA